MVVSLWHGNGLNGRAERGMLPAGPVSVKQIRSFSGSATPLAPEAHPTSSRSGGDDQRWLRL